MRQRQRQRFVPRVESPFKKKEASDLPKPAYAVDQLIIHPSPWNKVRLCEGILSKTYDAVGARSGKKCGVFAVMQFSASTGYRILMGNRAAIWKEADSKSWFKSDVKKAAEEDASIRAFVASHPEMGISI